MELPDEARLPPERRVEVALLRLTVMNGFAPVPDEALAQALPEFQGEELEAVLAAAVKEDIARRIPEGWILRTKGPTETSRYRLLLRP